MRAFLRTPSRLRSLAVAAAGVVVLAASARAQVAAPPTAEAVLASPAPYQVFQRGADGRADVAVTLAESVKDARDVSAAFSGTGGGAILAPLVDGKLRGVPTGGPYTVTVAFATAEGIRQTVSVGPVFVGDLWVLAGQSNMEGVADLVDVQPPDAKVTSLGMDGKWAVAVEPLHWLVDSPDPVHSGDPATRAERSAQQHKHRTKGAGLGLPFAVAMVQATGVPVGLVPTAHGGTSMAQWDPARKNEGGNSLYGSMLRQIQLAGGKVKGVLWYQGESDANPEASKIFERVFTDFIAAVRADLGQPDLPFYYVQIGRFVRDGDPADWNRVQEAQRVIADRVANTAVVTAIDQALDDPIHVGTEGQKRAGERLARIALRQLFGQAAGMPPAFATQQFLGRVGATIPTFDRVVLGPNGTLEVRFRGVNVVAPPPSGIASAPTGLTPATHIAGFSIRDAAGALVPLIYEAKVGRGLDTVVLKLAKAVPPGSFLWYGYGFDPYCNLVDGADMAVPVFGPVALDPILPPPPAKAQASKAEEKKDDKPTKALIITGDEVGAHDWRATSQALKEVLSEGGGMTVDVTETPAKDLTDENLKNYDVFILDYRDTDKGGPDTKWSDANKEAFLKAVREGKGLVSYHFASSAFTNPNWEEFEKALGGWRKQGFHGPAHAFKVKKTDADHPISAGMAAEFDHAIDELYQNSMLPEGAVVLATAYSDPEKPKGTGKDEPVIWVNRYGEGRIFTCVLGHDVAAIKDPNVSAWLRRGARWAATGEAE